MRNTKILGTKTPAGRRGRAAALLTTAVVGLASMASLPLGATAASASPAQPARGEAIMAPAASVDLAKVPVYGEDPGHGSRPAPLRGQGGQAGPLCLHGQVPGRLAPPPAGWQPDEG